MSEVALKDEELESLMAQLEAETGVPSVTTAAPAAKSVAEPGATVAEAPVPSAEMFSADELDELDDVEASLQVAEEKPKAAAQSLQAGLAALSGNTPAEKPKEPETVDEDDLLAELEAENEQGSAEIPEPEPQPEPEKTKVAATVATHKPGGVFSAPLQFTVDPNEFKKETAINPHDLDSCFVQQSSLKAYYNTQSAHAEAQASRIKLRFEIIEAKLYDEARRTAAAGGAKVTEKAVENTVKADPRWLAAKERLIDAEMIASVNKGLAASLADRRDMLIQLGANQRDESKGAMRMAAAKEAAESLSARAAMAGANAFNK